MIIDLESAEEYEEFNRSAETTKVQQSVEVDSVLVRADVVTVPEKELFPDVIEVSQTIKAIAHQHHEVETESKVLAVAAEDDKDVAAYPSSPEITIVASSIVPPPVISKASERRDRSPSKAAADRPVTRSFFTTSDFATTSAASADAAKPLAKRATLTPVPKETAKPSVVTSESSATEASSKPKSLVATATSSSRSLADRASRVTRGQKRQHEDDEEFVIDGSEGDDEDEPSDYDTANNKPSSASKTQKKLAKTVVPTSKKSRTAVVTQVKVSKFTTSLPLEAKSAQSAPTKPALVQDTNAPQAVRRRSSGPATANDNRRSASTGSRKRPAQEDIEPPPAVRRRSAGPANDAKQVARTEARKRPADEDTETPSAVRRRSAGPVAADHTTKDASSGFREKTPGRGRDHFNWPEASEKGRCKLRA
jgi:hypothetical protein